MKGVAFDMRWIVSFTEESRGERRAAGRMRQGMGPRRVRACLAALVGAAVAAPVFAQQQPALAGTWTWTRKSNGCSEQYEFRDNGTLVALSRDARTESQYRMAWAPEPNGRYKLTLVIVKDNGARDCADLSGDRTGQQMTAYLLFGGSRQTMLLCNSLNGPDCIGPLQKNPQ